MRITASQLLNSTLAVSLLGAALSGQRALAQGYRPPSAPVPVAPAGGIDPSRLPDIQGIHLGMSPQDTFNRMKPLYPQNGTASGVTPSYERFNQAPGSSFVSSMIGIVNPCLRTNESCSDDTTIVFNMPPNKQGVVSIQRSLQFQMGKEPTPETIKAALIQKYGPNPIVINANLLGWSYDEQGRPTAPSNGKGQLQCAGNIREAVAGGPSPTNATPAGSIKSIGGPLTQAEITDLMRDQCRVGVYVLVNMTIIGPKVTILDIKVSENSEDTRAIIATQRFLDNIAAGQQRQQIKNAQQQAAPKL